MKEAKLFISLLMTAVMVFAFCACGGGSTDNSPITEDEISELYTSPDTFEGRTFEFTGQVLDVEKDGGDLFIQVYQDIKNYENNTIVIYPEADVKLKVDDFVKVKGVVDGVFSGENLLGGEVEAPQITASKVKLIDAVEAFPATKTVEVDQTVTKGDYKATVSKVDFTQDETRIYLKVENNSSSTFDNYPDTGAIVQDGKQYEADWSEYYPEPSTELKAGASSESIIVFELIDEADFTYSFEGYDDDYNDVEFEFDIKVE
ncbi:MAG: hypothetical protein Q4A65_05425 [Bacillota bacterium]|nr:hypothetical protein [Bacillota bacterium]